MFIAALFTLGRKWNQPQCLTADEWINKVWCVCPVELYSVKKKDKMCKKWVELEYII